MSQENYDPNDTMPTDTQFCVDKLEFIDSLLSQFESSMYLILQISVGKRS
jgi:hypothetical protein